MKSPITGKEMILKRENISLKFRKENFTIQNHFFVCQDSSEQFTTTELDELNLLQAHNQYRDKYNLPFPIEIKEIRNMYNLSAVKMSETLGFGVNSYRNYENGEMPSISNGRIIQLMNDPKKFLSVVEISEVFKGAQQDDLISTINKLIKQEENNIYNHTIESYLMKDGLPDLFTGYVKPSLGKLTEMVVYFTKEVNPFKTKLNKLLFYSDFLSFRSTCYSMSGAKYRAIKMGPVPYNFNSLFEFMVNENHIDIMLCDFGEGRIGEKFTSHPDRVFNPDLFSESEIKILEVVALKFKNSTTSGIVEFSHQEKGWIENNESRSLISYNYAFDISQV